MTPGEKVINQLADRAEKIVRRRYGKKINIETIFRKGEENWQINFMDNVSSQEKKSIEEFIEGYKFGLSEMFNEIERLI